MSSAQLKAQGNALFSAKNFKEAAKKYAAAIKAGDEAVDPKGLAVLYANRAACQLSLKSYLDAMADALKATRLDPTYGKAFARLAQANHELGNHPQSKTSWQRALDLLPKSDLSPAQQIQRAQYQAGLAAADAGVAQLNNPPIVGERTVWVQRRGRMPWDLAAAMLPRLQAAQPANLYSSAWVIHGAHEEFMNGITKMNQLQIDRVADSESIRGIPGAITDLSNAIMRDPRVMHFPDNEFISKYNKQMMIEINEYKPWTDAGPEMVIREALARQRSEGWDSTRRAVTLTVRAWIMRAVMDAGLRQRYDVAVELYKHALEVLRSLRESWIRVPLSERGVVFEESFLFGIQHLYIDAIMQSHCLNPSPELLEELEKASDLLIREVDEALWRHRSQEPEIPAMVSSFYLYPRGSAYAMKGYCYNKKAGLNPDDKEFCRQAAIAYIKAAEAFPEDDEQHPWFLNAALRNMFTSQSFPLRETLDIMKRIRLAAPKAKEIWENSPLSASGLWATLAGVGRQEEELRGMVAQGKFTMDACVGDGY
ncbi:hypothetical protein FB451DRAFT_1246238 [Mycena latifolia]|nr:hypothetical protein FB451DRAFT_1246238 [Mycena latifolia]